MMSIDKSKISPSQFVFTIVCFIESSAVLSSFFVGISGRDSWFVMIIGYLVYLPLLFIIAQLMKRFPEKTIIEINDEVFGKVFGKVVSVFYIWFFVTLTSLNLLDTQVFASSSIVQKTPPIVLLATFALICVWAVRNGISVLTRYMVIIGVLSLMISVLAFFFAIKRFDFANLLPPFQQKPMIYVQSAHVVSTIPFGETIVFLMLTPNVKSSPKKFGKYLLIGTLIGAASMFVITVRDIGVLGETIKFFTVPSLETQRVSGLSRTFSRLELLYSIIFIALMYSKIVVLLYASVSAISQVLKLKSYKHISILITVLCIIYTLNLYDSGISHAISGMTVVPFFWSFLEYILPILTLVVVMFRKLGKKEGGANDDDIRNSGKRNNLAVRPSVGNQI
jgi:spore germination protein KB